MYRAWASDGAIAYQWPMCRSPDGYGYIVSSYRFGRGSSSSTLYIPLSAHRPCHFGSISAGSYFRSALFIVLATVVITGPPATAIQL